MSGYRANSAYREANVRNVSLPDQIKCQRCSKRKAQRNYSNKQLNDAKEKVRRGQEVTAVCMTCNGQPPVELECQRCDAWKPLDEFSKVQRKNPDHAVCEKCMAVQVEIEPVEASGIRGAEDSDDDGGEDDGNTHFTPWGPTTAAPTNEGQSVDLLGMSSRPAATTTAPSSSGFNPNSYAATARASSTTGSTRANAAADTVKSSSGFGGFNPNAYGAASRASSTTGSMRANVPASRSSAFPKVPAYKPPKQQQQDDDYDNDQDAWAGNQQDDDESSDEDTRM
ncbi:Stc1 domain-containing protein [Phyllosticta citribraziliensis]|uniref:Stc1 domain-containing protein n=1 Tax=Phyllosticta citribraziliensis TaxID=989973 RepID=A0ABR1MBU3_9PEZI